MLTPIHASIFVTSANIHTQDLFVLINKFQRFSFMHARSARSRSSTMKFKLFHWKWKRANARNEWHSANFYRSDKWVLYKQQDSQSFDLHKRNERNKTPTSQWKSHKFSRSCSNGQLINSNRFAQIIRIYRAWFDFARHRFILQSNCNRIFRSKNVALDFSSVWSLVVASSSSSSSSPLCDKIDKNIGKNKNEF